MKLKKNKKKRKNELIKLSRQIRDPGHKTRTAQQKASLMLKDLWPKLWDQYNLLKKNNLF